MTAGCLPLIRCIPWPQTCFSATPSRQEHTPLSMFTKQEREANHLYASFLHSAIIPAASVRFLLGSHYGRSQHPLRYTKKRKVERTQEGRDPAAILVELC